MCDLCRNVPNPGQQDDGDNDGVADMCDNCPSVPNGRSPVPGVCASGEVGKICWYNFQCGDGASCSPTPKIGTCTEGNVGALCAAHGACGPGGYCSMDQENADGDSFGDACDEDDDNDGILDGPDNCRTVHDPNQQDTDGDGIGDACNGNIDADGDNWADSVDNCPQAHNSTQLDLNNNGIGDDCEYDLTIDHVEITQSVQNSNNSLPIISGNDIWVRVYLDVGESRRASLSPVTGTLRFVDENGSQIQTYINGMLAGFVTLSPINGPFTANSVPVRDNLNDTLNFFIPKTYRWSSTPHINIQVTNNSPFDEINPWNNSIGPVPLNLMTGADINLMFVPVKVNDCIPNYFDFMDSVAFVEWVYPIHRINVVQDQILHFDEDPTEHNQALLFDIWWRNLWTNDPLDDMHYYGLVCPRSVIGGSGTAGTGGTSFLNNDEAWGMMDDPPSRIGGTMAHELGHNYGLEHVPSDDDASGNLICVDNDGDGQCDCADPDDTGFYPQYTDENGNDLPRASIGELGFDGNALVDPSSNYDIMSYCSPSWISPYHYLVLYQKFGTIVGASSLGNQFPTLQDNGPDQNYIIVSGSFQLDDTVLLNPFRISMLPVGSDDDSGIGTYSVELLDAVGNLLFLRNFEPITVSPSTGPRPFFEKMPYSDQTSRILLKSGGTTLSTVVVSANTPIVNVQYPNGGEYLGAEATISWTGTDVDGDEIVYDLFYSHDGGNTWRSIATGLSTNSYLWDTSSSPGTDQGLIRVIATDGVNTGKDESDFHFSITEKSPEIVIMSPQNLTNFFLNETIVFEGRGHDLEDGLLASDAFTWFSDINGNIGTTDTISLENLSPGVHTITLSAEDSDGNMNSTDITITISSDEDSDGDKIGNNVDNCPQVYNAGQGDGDADGTGDACDDDDYDFDGFPDNIDNCRMTPNDQADADSDRIGDSCECPGDITPGGGVDGSDLASLASEYNRGDCTTEHPCLGDIDNDGDVDTDDLASFAVGFGKIRCETAKACTGLITYDTGNPGWHFAVSAGYGVAVKFTPPSYPWTLNEVRVWPCLVSVLSMWKSMSGMTMAFRICPDEISLIL